MVRVVPLLDASDDVIVGAGNGRKYNIYCCYSSITNLCIPHMHVSK